MADKVLSTVVLCMWLFQTGVVSGQLIMLGTEGEPFNFPWLCRIRYETEPAFTMCSLFHDNYAFTSADNWNKCSVKDETRRYYELLNEYRGRENFEVITEEEMPNPNEVASASIYRLWLPTTSKIVNASVHEGRSMAVINPANLRDIYFDATGSFSMGVALVQISGNSNFGRFKWSYEMLPIPLYDTDIRKTERAQSVWLKMLEKQPHLYSSCSAGTLREMPAGWGAKSGSVHTVVYHQLTYVPRHDCMVAYCAADLSLCMRFPAESHLVCFKPNTYTDFCDFDQGIALWCPWFEGSVFAILTHADSCGYRRLPSVYTLISGPLRLFAATQGRDLAVPQRPDYDKFQFVVPLPPFSPP